MKSRFIYAIFALVLTFTVNIGVFALSEDVMLRSVLKIKSYSLDDISGNYDFIQWGSATYVDKNHIITNAHVILDDKGIPFGFYELCRANNDKKDTDCTTTAKLLSYDPVLDIAYLEVSKPTPGDTVAVFSKTEPSNGNSVVVYGFPDIGGYGITRTEGKIGGTDTDDNFKFDGTLDAGSSGGGAFSADGKLLGIPVSIKSENSTIGYIIPAATVKDFIAKKTGNITNYTSPVLTNFTSYMKRTQNLYKNNNLLKTKYVEIRDAAKNGLFLRNITESIDGKIFNYQFSDKKERVIVDISCSRDATNNISPFDLVFGVVEYENKGSDYTGATKYLDKDEKILLGTLESKTEVKGERFMSALLMYKNALECNSEIDAKDARNKDKTLFEKAITFAKNIKFNNTIQLSKTYASSFFSLAYLPENVYISEGNNLDTSSILPHITALSEISITQSVLEIVSFDTARDLMNVGYDKDSSYKGTDMSNRTFTSRYLHLRSEAIKESVFTSRNGKNLYMTIVNKNPTNSEQPKTQLTIFYPFLTTVGQYRAYRFTFDFDSYDIKLVATIQSLFEAMTLPGSAPFKDLT